MITVRARVTTTYTQNWLESEKCVDICPVLELCVVITGTRFELNIVYNFSQRRLVGGIVNYSYRDKRSWQINRRYERECLESNRVSLCFLGNPCQGFVFSLIPDPNILQGGKIVLYRSICVSHCFDISGTNYVLELGMEVSM